MRCGMPIILLFLASLPVAAFEAGRSVGDVNGDSYDDVVVGAPDEDRAFVYYGSASGLSAAVGWMASSDSDGSRFGSSVDMAGDVNGDGFRDLIVGAEGEGAAYVYYGAPSGLPAAPSWTAVGGQDGAAFGHAVATAGDLNNDGYDDVVVGAPDFDDGETNEGRVLVYYGTASGLSTAAGWMAESGSSNARYGSWVGTAGDVNGDGYADLIVGASGGASFVYLGSTSGLRATPSTADEGSQEGWSFGSSAGNDVGSEELVIGAPPSDDVQTAEPVFRWFDANRVAFTESLQLPEAASGETWGVYWPVSLPVATQMFMGAQATTFNGNLNNVLCWAYNADCGRKITSGEAAVNMVMEGSYDSSVLAGRQNWIEYNWNFFPAGSGMFWRPFAFLVDTDANDATGAAQWELKPNDLNSGNNRALILEWPWTALGSVVGTDTYTDTGLSSFLRSSNANPGGTQSGIKNRFFLDHAENRAGPYVIGIDSKIEYDSTTAESKAGWMIGGLFTTRVSGSTDGRTFASFDGLWVNLELVSTGTAANPKTAIGVKVKHDFSGQNIVLWDKSAGFWLETPTAPGTSSTFVRHYGVLIDDQRFDRSGMTSGDALRISSQTVSHAGEGNAVVAGTGHNHGHLVVGSTHLWEEAAGQVAIKGSAPTSDADGLRVLASHRSSTSGPAAWAADGVTCGTACSNINAANCADAVVLDGPNNPAGDCTSTAGLRLCQCY